MTGIGRRQPSSPSKGASAGIPAAAWLAASVIVAYAGASWFGAPLLLSGPKPSLWFLLTCAAAVVLIVLRARFLRRALRRASTAPPPEGAVAPPDSGPLRYGLLLCGFLALALGSGLRLGGIVAGAVFAAYFVGHWLAGSSPARTPADHAPGSAAPRYRPHVLADNLSGLLAAVAMLVLAYNFALEAFRIPTGSMEPTLYGDQVWGDRALVDKLSYRLREPQRGEIVIFRFPLSRAKPYVKRLVGLPGETVLIADGDVYLRGADAPYPTIWRKSDAVREAMWLKLFAFDGTHRQFDAFLETVEGTCRLEDGAVFLEADSTLRYPARGGIVDHNPTSDHDPRVESVYGSVPVRDTRVHLSFTATADSSQDSMEIRVVRGEERIALAYCLSDGVSGTPDATLTLSRGAAEAPLEYPLGGGGRPLWLLSGQRRDLILAVADGEARVTINGHEFAPVRFETRLERAMRLAAEAGTLPDMATAEGRSWVERNLPPVSECFIEIHTPEWMVVNTLAVDRDVYYHGVTEYETRVTADGRHARIGRREGRRPYSHRVSPDGYFVLGDNSQNSLDSRLWNILELTLTDGTLRRVQVEEFVRPLQGEAARAAADLRETIHNTLMESPYAFDLNTLNDDLTRNTREGRYGRTLRFSDVFSVDREIAASAVESVRVRHTPEVPRDLMDGQMLASLFPKPRFVD